MKYKFYKIPVSNESEIENELNLFLSSHRIICVDRQFVSDASSSFWSFSIEYEGSESKPLTVEKKKSRIDYREVLSDEDFQRFSKLREWRKAKGVDLGVPIYTIFSNEHIAEIAKLTEITKVNIGEINGIGEDKVNKYFEEVKVIIGGKNE